MIRTGFTFKFYILNFPSEGWEVVSVDKHIQVGLECTLWLCILVTESNDEGLYLSDIL